MKQPQRILIMGLPGSGKTYLAQHLLEHLQNDKKRVAWLNADNVRKKYNDWDAGNHFTLAIGPCLSD